jgi:negative regulator of flagellin synthesis FlgM
MVSTIGNSTIGNTAQSIQQYVKSDSIKGESEKTTGSSTPTPTATEKVDLSANAKEIQRIKQIVDQTPEIRQEKVLDLKRQIEGGAYTINSGGIADKMLAGSRIDFNI